ncbi:MAG: HalOD1 output domain-containing protein [archaeon]
MIDIVETLETCGLDRDEYQLYDFIDVEALQQLVDSGRGDVEVRFTVEGIQLAVTADGIDVLSEREFRTADS